MQFSCGETREARQQRLMQQWMGGENQKWYRKFAWLPTTVKVKDGKKICVWLEYYERAFRSFYDYYGYHAGLAGVNYQTRLLEKE
jgi:hypothetical protein